MLRMLRAGNKGSRRSGRDLMYRRRALSYQQHKKRMGAINACVLVLLGQRSRTRANTKRYVRGDFSKMAAGLDDKEFSSTYKLTKPQFWALLERLDDLISHDAMQQASASGAPIKIEMALAVTLSFLAGMSSY